MYTQQKSNKQTNKEHSSETYPAVYSVVIVMVLWGSSGRSVMLTTHLLLARRLRMRGAIPLLPTVFLHGVDRDNF